jgi:hypothetical protein
MYIKMFVNTTPHDIVLYDEKKENILYKFGKSKYECRLKTSQQKLLKTLFVDGISIPIWSNQKFESLILTYNGEELKEIPKDIKFIVSLPIKTFIENNNLRISENFFVPDTNLGAVRKDGQIIGTTRLLN